MSTTQWLGILRRPATSGFFWGLKITRQETRVMLPTKVEYAQRNCLHSVYIFLDLDWAQWYANYRLQIATSMCFSWSSPEIEDKKVMSNRILVVIIWDARTQQNGHCTCIRRSPMRRRASNAVAYALVLRPVFFFLVSQLALTRLRLRPIRAKSGRFTSTRIVSGETAETHWFWH